MIARYIQDGHALDITPSADLAAGDVVVAGDLIGVAAGDITAHTLGAIQVTGVFEFPKATGVGTALSLGAKAYWDDTAKVATATAGANKPLGKVARAAADEDTKVRIRLTP